MVSKRLPAELHAIIFELVCIAELESDVHSYRTACNLCVVSRCVHSIVVTVMYRTLLIDGRTKASLLSRTLHCRPALGRYVQHLFISDHARWPRTPADDDTLEVPPSFAFAFPGSREGRIENRQRMGAWLTERAQTLTAFRCAVHHILCMTSTGLRVLSICLYGHYDGNSESILDEALARPFPLLLDLTIRDNVQPQPRSRLELPMLERLHLAGGNPPFPFKSLDSLADNYPHLTQILLTEPFINDVSVSVLESLFSADAHITPQEWEGWPRPPVKRFQRVILKPSLPSTSSLSKELCDRLARLSTRSDTFQLVHTPPHLDRRSSKRNVRYPLDEAIRDWMDYIRKCAGI